MGRIAWFDSLARKRYNQLDTFNTILLEPLKSQLFSST